MRTKYSTLGIFVLLLIAFTSFNSKKAKAECIADFADSLQCHTSAFFTDLSYTTTPGDFIVSWHWDFGDGGTSTSKNPYYTYATGGDYLVTLTIGSDLGCYDTLSKTVTVLSPMDADFYYSTECLIASFTDTSYVDPNDTILFWDWDFGDGNTSTLQNPVHTYAAGGNYTVTLMTTCDCSGIDIETQVVTVNCPVSNFTASPVCDGYLMCFVDLSIANAATIDSWDWDFGDGGTSTQQNPCHLFPASGTYNVTLTVMNNLGCYDDTTMQVEVYENPVADFTDSSCCDYDIYFTDLSIANADGITAWLWNFGDGGSSTLQNPIHTYAGAGSYNVCLIVVNNNGCIDSVCRAVIIPESFDIATNEANDATISIYPNPANNILNLRSTEAIDQLRILDLNGRTIDMMSSGIDQSTISTSELDNGIYILEITIGKNIIQKRFIVNHQ